MIKIQPLLLALTHERSSTDAKFIPFCALRYKLLNRSTGNKLQESNIIIVGLLVPSLSKDDGESCRGCRGRGNPFPNLLKPIDHISDGQQGP